MLTHTLSVSSLCFINCSILSLSEPSIDVFPSDTRATEGEEVYLKVKVSGHPPPTITWYHNGTVVTADYATGLDDDGGISFPCIETKHSGQSVFPSFMII